MTYKSSSRWLTFSLVTVLMLLGGSSVTAQTNATAKPNKIESSELGSAKNVHRLGNLFFAGQFAQEDIATLKKNGVTRVITLRTDGEVKWDEEAEVKNAGMEFFKAPFRSPEGLTDEVFDSIRELLKDKSKTTLFHCGSANRVGGVWLPHRVLDEGVELETALKEAKEIGLHTEFIEEKALDYIKRMQEKSSVHSNTSLSGNKSNWPAFRGNGSSHTSVANLPTEWSDDKNIAWTAELLGYGQSSPIIWGDQVFTTTMQGDMKDAPTILCYRLADGKQLWKKEFKGTQTVKASDYVTRSSPTPAVDADRCYAFFESGELIATDHAGNVQWQRSLVTEYGEFKGNHGIGSSLAINDDFIFVLVAHDGPSYLLAVNKTTGKNAWKTDLDKKVSWSSPVVADDVVLVSVSGSVRGFDTKSGDRIWSVDDVKGNTVASATFRENVAFIGSSERAQNFAVRFDPTGKSTETELVWKSDEATSSFGSPLYHDGRVYYVSKPGVAFSLDATTGKTIWKERLSGSCWASPIAAGDKIYFFTKEGPTDVYSAGAIPEKLGTNNLTVKDRLYGVAVADGCFVALTGTRLICISNFSAQPVTQEDGDAGELKIADCPVPVTSFGAATCDGYVYVYGGNVGAAHSYFAKGQNNQFRRIKLANGAKWESLGEVPRRQGNALVAHKGKLYRIGGFEAKNETAEEDEQIVSTTDFAAYDPKTSKWTDLAPLPEPRSSFDAVVAGDVLYVVGGWALDGDRDDSQWHGTAWKMDLSADELKWTSIPAPPERRANSLAELNGKIYLIGGMGDDASPTRSVKVFDTTKQEWTDGPELPGMPMDGFGSSSFNVGGHIVVSTFGGQVIQLSKDGTKWKQIDKIKPGRFFHRLVPINGTEFVILGGTSPGAKQSSVLVLER